MVVQLSNEHMNNQRDNPNSSKHIKKHKQASDSKNLVRNLPILSIKINELFVDCEASKSEHTQESESESSEIIKCKHEFLL